MATSGPEHDTTRSTEPVDRFLLGPAEPAGRRRTVMSEAEIGRSLRRMAHEIIERCGDPDSLSLVGICTRGAPLAERLADTIEAIEGVRPRVGQLDITMHRDDLAIRAPMREILPSRIDFSLDGLNVILVDDVVYTGRSLTAATANSPSAPITSARTCRPGAPTTYGCLSPRSMKPTGSPFRRTTVERLRPPAPARPGRVQPA